MATLTVATTLINGRLVATAALPAGHYVQAKVVRKSTGVVEATLALDLILSNITSSTKGIQFIGDSQTTGSSTGDGATLSYRARLKAKLNTATWDVNAIDTTGPTLARNGQVVDDLNPNAAGGFYDEACVGYFGNPPAGQAYVKANAENEWWFALGTNDKGNDPSVYPQIFDKYGQIFDLVRGWGVTEIGVIIPGDTSLAPDAPDSYFYGGKAGLWRQGMLDRLSLWGIKPGKVLDLYATPFGRNRQGQPEITIGDNLHYNAYAHEGISDLLLPLIG